LPCLANCIVQPTALDQSSTGLFAVFHDHEAGGIERANEAKTSTSRTTSVGSPAWLCSQFAPGKTCLGEVAQPAPPRNSKVVRAAADNMLKWRFWFGMGAGDVFQSFNFRAQSLSDIAIEAR
jgi:hypothetical protein